MCGLFGAYSHLPLSKPEVDRVIELGFMSALRGLDSTGVAVVRKKPGSGKWHINTQKDTVNPVSFLSRFSVEKFLREPQPSIIVGHARRLTIGANNIANAQPLVEDHIYGCHNGTMYYYAPSQNDKEQKSDSRNLFASIAKQGLTKTLGATSTGVYALSYLNIKDMTLNFIKNDDRPLWFVRSKQDTLYWASELRFLECMMTEYGGPDYYFDPYTLKKNELQQIKWGKGDVLLEDKEEAIQDAYRVKYPVVTTPAPSLLTGRLSGGLFCKACTWRTEMCNCPKGSKKVFIRPEDKNISACGRYFINTSAHVSVPLIPYTVEKYLGFERQHWTISQAIAKLNAEGCAECKEKKTVDDKTYWYDKDSYVCKDCYLGDNEVREMLKPVKVYGSSKIVGRHNA